MGQFLFLFRGFQQTFRHNRWVTLAAILVLGAGIGLSLSIFTLFTNLLSSQGPGISPAPFATFGIHQSSGALATMRWYDFEKLRSAKDNADEIAAVSPPVEIAVKAPNFNGRVKTELVSSEYFRVLGLELFAGKTIQRGDEQTVRVALLRADVARKWFGSADSAIGNIILVEGNVFQVAGVVPASFRGSLAPDVSMWLSPRAAIPVFADLPEDYKGTAADLYRSSDLWARINAFYAVMRAQDEHQLQVHADLIRRRLADLHLQAVEGIDVDPEHHAKLVSWTKLALMLSIAVFLVAALNFGAFQVAQVPRRQNELRMRQMLGAQFRHLCIELLRGPLHLLFVSAAVGVALEIILLRLFRYSSIFSSEVAMQIRPVHLSDFVFFIAFILLGLLAIGGLPVIELFKTVKPSADRNRITSSKGTRTLLLAVVASQSALSLVGVLSAFFLVRSLWNWKNVDCGFNHSAVAVAVLGPKDDSAAVTTSSSGDFPLATYSNAALQKLRSLPGVESAAVATSVPLSRTPIFTHIARLDGTPVRIEYNAVTRDYFQTLGISILEGRTFSSSSLTGTPNEAVINVSLARMLFPDGKALGSIVNVPIAPEANLDQGDKIPTVPMRIVGIVTDVLYDGPAHSANPLFYLPLAGAYMSHLPMFVVRGHVTPANLETQLRQVFEDNISGLTITDSFLIETLFNESLRMETMRAEAAIGSGLVLLLLALVGMYGISRFRIATRQRELAIRICLGAGAGSLMRLVAREMLFIASGSLLAAIAVWTIWKNFLAQYTYKTALWNPYLWAGGVAIWLLIMTIAFVVPSLRIIQFRPAELLSAE